MPEPPNFDDPKEVLESLPLLRTTFGLHRSAYAGTNCPECCSTMNVPRGMFYSCPCKPHTIIGNSIDDSPPWITPDYGPTLKQIEKALRWERESN